MPTLQCKNVWGFATRRNSKRWQWLLNTNWRSSALQSQAVRGWALMLWEHSRMGSPTRLNYRTNEDGCNRIKKNKSKTRGYLSTQSITPNKHPRSSPARHPSAPNHPSTPSQTTPATSQSRSSTQTDRTALYSVRPL